MDDSETDHGEPIDYIYETNENGDRVIVRSLESETSVWFRFINKTSRPVDVWWRGYKGERKLRTRMKPGASYRRSTYLTHAWEFVDAATYENYVINNKQIFRAPDVIGDNDCTGDWYITIPVRTLRHTALLAVASQIKDPKMVDELGLPKKIADDIKTQVTLVKEQKPTSFFRRPSEIWTSDSDRDGHDDDDDESI